MRPALKIGILYSETGSYGTFGRDCRDGADLAIAELSADPSFPLEIEPVYADPGGDPRRYLEEARLMLREKGCRQIVGTIISLARKEVIPLVEKHDGLLWYVCPYEGFEANENVVYIGAVPNQHLVPLFDHLLPSAGKRAFLLGANYVWGWEMNRLARDLLADAGGEVVGERCLPLEDTDVDRIIAEIVARRPDFVLNNLVGPASWAFLTAFDALGRRDPAFAPQNCPVVSCDLTECELRMLAPGVAEGHLSIACYFDSLDTPENRAFKASVAGRYGSARKVSSFFEGAYLAVRRLAEAAALAGTDSPDAIKQALAGRTFSTPHGAMWIDPRTNHAALPIHLGRIRGDGGFDVILSRPAIAADPYLTASRAAAGRPALRVVS